jgi:cell wall-associated NlpC family hydrolase
VFCVFRLSSYNLTVIKTFININKSYVLCLLLAFFSVSCSAIEPMPMPTADANVSLEQISKEQNTYNWSGRAGEVLVNALSLTGIKYARGGNTPETGFDCSGFVRYVFKQAASLTLPHSALAISQIGKTVPKNDLQPGDLVFFNTMRNTFSHVGIYLGNNRFIHSPSAGGKVRVENMQDGYWSTRFSGAQRIDADKNLLKEAVLVQ